ncbi:MAG: hypothetical protein C0594_12915 [Marinilabiliales bacterium]|nr:MAG: hypothetical protein C0594_12915 [Marinilabiliales bacterium]
MRIQKNKILFYILIFGFLIRLIFILFGADQYFNRENIYVDGDTKAWSTAFENLVEHGEYTVNPDSEYGYFGRMPGYSMFMGSIWLVTGKNWELSFMICGWLQTILDTISIYFIFLIGNALINKKTGLTTAFLYALYPFIIVWNPVAYSESPAIFFLLASLALLTNKRTAITYLLSGILIGMAALNRPQILIFVPFAGLFILMAHSDRFFKSIKPILFFSLGFLLMLGPWTARNIINHEKPIITQDLRGFPNWNTDVISFMQYIYSVKAEWSPQFEQILQNKTVELPDRAYTSRKDSILLKRTLELCKTCGSGFSHWNGYWKEPIKKENCNDEISKNFDYLRTQQIETNPFSYYIKIPLQNLKKAIFKSSLQYDAKSGSKLASILFLYRSFLILLALAGSFILIREKRETAFIPLSWMFLYIALCFGTGVQFRNIEMRYFLPADILMLIPAAHVIHIILNRLKRTPAHE